MQLTLVAAVALPLIVLVAAWMVARHRERSVRELILEDIAASERTDRSTSPVPTGWGLRWTELTRPAPPAHDTLAAQDTPPAPHDVPPAHDTRPAPHVPPAQDTLAARDAPSVQPEATLVATGAEGGASTGQ